MAYPHYRTLLSAGLAAMLALVACGRQAPTGGGSLVRRLIEHFRGARTATAFRSSTTEDPCALLEPKEVEAALGAPLAVPPFRTSGGEPKKDGTQCAYEDAHFHRIVVDVTWNHATFAWKMLGNIQNLVNQGPAKAVHIVEGSDIAGSWDEARVQGCCSFAALLGDQSVTVDVGGSPLEIAAAAKLADAALKRLSKPLAIDGNAGVAAAQAYEAQHRPKPRDPCSLVTRQEAEAVLGGPLIADPKAEGSSCDYELPPKGIRQVYELQIQWTGGFAKFREENAMLAGVAKGFAPTTEIEKLLSGADVRRGPWEAAHVSMLGVSAVKDDVMMQIDTRGLDAAKAARLIEKAMSKL